MAKRDRRRRAGNDDKKSGAMTVGNNAFRQNALRAVLDALARAEETVRSIDAALRRKLKSQRRSGSTNRRSKARQG